MEFSGKMCLMIILQVTKYQGFTLSLEDTFLEDRYIFRKPPGWGFKFPPPPPLPLSPAVLGLNNRKTLGLASITVTVLKDKIDGLIRTLTLILNE